MEFNDAKIKELAIRIYDLDTEVYEELGSSIGRVFSSEKDLEVRNIMEALHSRNTSSRVRSELALISNMARTIQDKNMRHNTMIKYDQILHDIKALPTSFTDGDILEPKIADLNHVNLKDRFKSGDHLIICIGRSCGCGGNEIGFALADKLRMNFYDVSVMNEVFKQIEGADAAQAVTNFEKRHFSLKRAIREFKKYHGLSGQDALFFETSRLLVQKAKEEDFIVMGRFADAILTNNHIPHISLFITAPEKRRIKRFVEINQNVTPKQAKKWIESEDLRHLKTYKFYTGRKWSKASNYDMCINSASYGIKGSVDMIIRSLNIEEYVKDNLADE